MLSARKRSKRCGARRQSRKPIQPPQSWPTSFTRSRPSSSSTASTSVGQVLLLVAVARRVGPAEAAQVERQHPVAVGQRRHQVAPLVPVLRPAVQAEDDVVAGARFGDVEVESARPHRAVADARRPSMAGSRRARRRLRAGRAGHAPRPSVQRGRGRLAEVGEHLAPSSRRRRRPFPATACRDAPEASSGRCR